ncbi:MAG: VWA domain-containing protein [Acidobacteriota bacterium]
MRIGICIILTLSLLLSALAQQDDKPIKLQTDLVAIDVTITDKDGNFLRNLKREDFVIYEDNEPQKVEFFEANEKAAFTRPLAVVFAFDISGSITPEEIDRQRQATEKFMSLVQRESVYSVVAFNNEIRVLQDFSNDANKISQAFRKIKDTSGSTRIFATIGRAVEMLKKVPRYRGARRLRRVVVIVTDGYDNVDPTEQTELIQSANDAEVTVYSITLPSYPAGGNQPRIMTLLDVSRVVPSTGGADFSADVSDFTPVFKAIAEEIQSGYTVAYYPSEKSRNDGRAHQLRVEVKKTGAIVRASRSSFQSAK